MRIGIDGLGMQSGSAGRGIGRYLRELVKGMADRLKGDLVVYLSADLPRDGIPEVGTRRVIGPPFQDYSHALQNRAYENPERIDLLLIGSPFETHARHWLPEFCRSSVRLAAIAYDLVPLLYPDEYLKGDPYTPAYKAACDVLRYYPHFLSLSDATSADFVRMFGVDPASIVNISAAVDRDFFRPDPAQPLPSPRLTGGRPFVFYMGQAEARKNLDGMVRAFGLLPAPLRDARSLVVVCPMSPARRRKLDAEAARFGCQHRMVVHDRIASDEDLRALYRTCDAFVFPSLCEGFGLPLLEAMSCGAPVICGDNSSQPEVAGDGAVRVDASDPVAISAALRGLLSNPARSATLRRLAVAQAGRFSWRRTADLAVGALAEWTRDAAETTGASDA